MSGPARKWLALSILILMLGSGGTGPLLAAGDPMHLAESEHPAVPWTSPARYVDSAARALALEAQRQPLVPAVTVRVADVPQVAYAGIYLALARGYFQQEGLDIRLEPFTTGEQTVPAVATGQVDVAPGAISAALFNALARGIDLKIVAGQSIAVPGYYNAGLMVRKELWDAGRVREYADLRGLRVAIPSWSSVQGPVWARLLAGGGLTEGDVQVVPLTPPDMPTALSNGGLDVGMMNEPFATRAIQLGVGVRWLSHGDIYPGQQITTLIYSPAFAERQPEAATRFLVAYLRGVRDYTTIIQGEGDRTPLYQVLAEYTPVKDLSLYATMAPTAIVPDGAINLAALQADHDWWRARGDVAQPANLAQAIDLRYLDAARRLLDAAP